MDRNEAVAHLKARLTNKNLIKHSLAVEAIMSDLAEILSEDKLIWSLAGLLHDIDLDRINNDMSKHSLVGAEILDMLGVDEAIIYAVKAHNAFHGIERRRKIDKALYCADPMSGMITACALILPDKSLNEVDVEFVIKRMKEKGFAKGVNREAIMECELLGLSLESFIEISLNAMKRIKVELEL